MQNNIPGDANAATPSVDSLATYIPIEEFARAKETTVVKIIQKIRDGACVGLYENNAWYVSRDELREFKVEGSLPQWDASPAEIAGSTHSERRPNQGGTILTALPNGELGVPTTFWIFAVLGNFIFVILMFVLVQISEDLTLFLVSAFAAYQYWVLIGLIRSSRLQKGSSGWALLAVIIHLAFVAVTSFAWLFTFSVYMNGYASH